MSSMIQMGTRVPGLTVIDVYSALMKFPLSYNGLHKAVTSTSAPICVLNYSFNLRPNRALRCLRCEERLRCAERHDDGGFLDLNAGSSKFQSPRSKGVLDLSKLKSPGSNGDLSKRQFSGFLDSNGGVLKSPGSNGDLSKRQFPGFLDSNGVLDRNKQSTGSSSSVRVSWADEVDLRKDKEDFQLNSPFSLNTDQAVEEASTILNSVVVS
ncbi:uncharacterized protein A4U43_C08F14890 [Asparagus officinalis]|nr:uncharacterized protein A4U43_C08F14890 [Asparagus officinalis]